MLVLLLLETRGVCSIPVQFDMHCCFLLLQCVMWREAMCSENPPPPSAQWPVSLPPHAEVASAVYQEQEQPFQPL